MLSLFRTNQSYASLLLFVYALVLQLPLLLLGAEAPVLTVNEGYFGLALTEWMTTQRVLSLVLPALLIGVVGLTANRLTDRFHHSRTITQFPGLLVVLTWGLSPAFRYFDVVQLNHLLLLFALFAVGGLYRTDKPQIALFNAGCWLGLASMFRPAYLLYIPGLLIAVGILRTIGPRSILQFVVGILVIYFLTGVYAFWVGDIFNFWVAQARSFGLGEPVAGGYYAKLGIYLLGFVLLVVLLRSEFIKSLLNIQGSKNISVLYWLLLFSLPVACLGGAISIADAQVAVLPLGILLGLLFVRLPAARAEVYHLLLFSAATALSVLYAVS